MENVNKKLSVYLNNPTVITLEELDDVTLVPYKWVQILTQSGENRIKKTIEYWADFNDEFSTVISYLDNFLAEVQLLKCDNEFILLYVIKTDDDIFYYCARNPISMSISSDIKELWKYLPEKLKLFYTEFHNGWLDVETNSMGLFPVEKFFRLDSDDWGILDDLEESPVRLNKTIALFSNGGGGYICFTIIDKIANELIWWSDEEPTFDVEFWPLVDSWTAMAFEEK